MPDVQEADVVLALSNYSEGLDAINCEVPDLQEVISTAKVVVIVENWKLYISRCLIIISHVEILRQRAQLLEKRFGSLKDWKTEMNSGTPSK